MKIEKICEYFNDIGLLKLNTINTFLKIYSQISKNKYKNESDKLVLALFSYLALASKNDQNLYDICKNIIDSLTNNQIIYRYRGIKLLYNIFRTKLHSRYNLFFTKLNHFIFKKQNYKLYNKRYNFNVDSKDSNKFNNDNANSIKKGKIIRKKSSENNKNINDFNDIIEKLSSEKDDYVFSPQINDKYKSNMKKNNILKRDINLNYNYDNYNNTYYRSNDFNDNLNGKNFSFKSNVNYGYNDKINN